MKTMAQLKKLYEDGVNITQYLRTELGSTRNTVEIIEIAYELQAGSYTAAMNDPETAMLKREYSLQIAKVIQSLCQPRSLLEAGVSEATTLSGVVSGLDGGVMRIFGFDLSWSRLACASRWLKSRGLEGNQPCDR